MRREFPDAPIVGVGAVVIEGQRVLLIRRAQEPLLGHWSLPGGALELGETLEQGMRREVLEETGLHVRPVQIVEVLDSIVADPATGAVRFHYVLIDFLCTLEGGTLAAASDAGDAKWMTRDHFLDAGRSEAGPVIAPLIAPMTSAVIAKAFRIAAQLSASETNGETKPIP